LLSRAPRIAQARLFFDGKTVCAPVDPPAASIARYDLDAALWQAAKDAGMQAELETTVDRIVGEGPFLLSTAAGEFCAKALIDASGRWSNLRSRPSDGNPGNKWLGLKAHYAEPEPAPSVDLYFFEGGYCGVQPVTLAGDGNGRINVCAMVRSDRARNLPEVFAACPPLRERASRWQLLMDPVTTSPLIFGEPEPVRGNILLAGDAAGFVDPFVGDGISLALRSGVLAAQCLERFLDGQTTISEAAADYAQAYRKRLLPVFRNSSKLRRLLALPRPVRGMIGHLLETVPAVPRLLVTLTR
jgi:flavin-dependent dehydrogenase